MKAMDFFASFDDWYQLRNGSVKLLKTGVSSNKSFSKIVTIFYFQFFCSMSATFTLNFFLSGLQSNSWGYFYMPGLINFGVFKVNYFKDI